MYLCRNLHSEQFFANFSYKTYKTGRNFLGFEVETSQIIEQNQS